jgi:hypothetical protein
MLIQSCICIRTTNRYEHLLKVYLDLQSRGTKFRVSVRAGMSWSLGQLPLRVDDFRELLALLQSFQPHALRPCERWGRVTGRTPAGAPNSLSRIMLRKAAT